MWVIFEKEVGKTGKLERPSSTGSEKKKKKKVFRLIRGGTTG